MKLSLVVLVMCLVATLLSAPAAAAPSHRSADALLRAVGAFRAIRENVFVTAVAAHDHHEVSGRRDAIDDRNEYLDWQTAFTFFAMLAICMCVFPVTAVFAILCSPCLMLSLFITGVGLMNATQDQKI